MMGRSTHRAVVRFLIVGGSVTLLNLILVWIFVSAFGRPYLQSSVVAYGISAGVSFGLQRSWTFSVVGGGAARQLPQFLIINFLGLILNSAIVYALTEDVGLWYVVAQAAASLCVAIQSFVCYRWLFQSAPGSQTYGLSTSA